MWSVETIMRSLWTNEGPIIALTNEWGVYCQLIGSNNAVSSRPILWAYAQHSPRIVQSSASLLVAQCPEINWPSGDCWHPRLDKYCNILNINHSSGISCGHYYPLSTTPLLVPFWGQFSSCSCINCLCWWELWVRDSRGIILYWRVVTEDTEETDVMWIPGLDTAAGSVQQILLVFCQPLSGVPTAGGPWVCSSKHSQQQNLHSLQETLSMQILTNIWLAFVWDPWWITVFDKEVSSQRKTTREG